MLVNSSVQSPTYNSVATGAMPATANVPDLDVVSSLSADSQTLYLMVVNKSMTSQIQTSIALSGFVPVSQGITYSLTAASVDANNGPDINWAVAASLGVRRMTTQILAPTYSMFNSGAQGAVAVTQGTASNVGPTFTYTFPPVSITSIALKRAG
jgi:alpha-L-arabinofuranosidase